jgi:hypothetical protein
MGLPLVLSLTPDCPASSLAQVARSTLRLRMPLPETTPDRRRFGLRHAFRRLFAPIRDDDPSFPWRPVVVLLLGILLILATVITLSFLVAWLVTGQAY